MTAGRVAPANALRPSDPAFLKRIPAGLLAVIGLVAGCGSPEAAGGETVGGAGNGGGGAGGSVSGGDSGSGGMKASAGSPSSGGVSGTGGLGGNGGVFENGGQAGSGGVVAGGTTEGCGKAPPQTGQFQASVMVSGVARGYYVSIPATYAAMEPHSLVFGYHGSGWNGEMMRGYLDMERAPLVNRSVFVYPDGIDGAWDLSPSGDDMLFFDAVVARMSADYCVDPSRIFVSGQSFGGMMSNAVGCARGDVVRAIAPIAGSGPYNPSACKGPVAAWIVHGMDDPNVSFTSGEKSRDFWAMQNGCSMSTTAAMPTGCQAYQGCSAGHPVIWCTHVDDTGHQEPNWARPAIREFFTSF